ncbi:MAG: T9SS type A sorting domain-containing protein [Bacteroidota bacterium]|nr:T9SS type A sorting domain-containing protein [Bacteroidota bacterium]
MKNQNLHNSKESPQSPFVSGSKSLFSILTLKKKMFFFLLLFIIGLSSTMAHVTEIRVNQAQNGSLTWYLQTYHGVNECGHQNAGLTINGINYPIDGEFSGSIVSISPTIFAQYYAVESFGRSSYATVHTAFLGTNLTVAPYSNNVCWAFLVGGSGNFTPPPPPTCTTCPILSWSNTVSLPGNNNGTVCNLTDDYTTANITVNHLSCASITANHRFKVILDPAGSNTVYGYYNYSSGISTSVAITIPYGTSNSTQVSVVDDDFPCTITHGLSIPNGQYSGVQLPLPIISAGGPTTFCAGGSVTLTASPGVSYTWSNSETTQSINVTQSGNYTVTVLNSGGCSVTSLPLSVTVNPTPTAQVSATPIICSGGNNGSVIVTGTGGTTPYQYSNDNGASFQSSGTYGSLGAGTYISIVKGSNGCSSAPVTSVILIDNVPPVVNTNNITVYLNASGSATITSAQIDNGSTDNCSISSYSLSKTSFDCSNTGPNSVTLTVTDANNNSANGNAIVTVIDNIAPVVVTQNVSVTLLGGTASVSAAQINNGSNDACGIASISVSPSSFSCANIGPNVVTLTVTDTKGNTNTGTATVTVNGVIPSCALSATGSGTVIGTTTSNAAVNQMFLGYGYQSMTVSCAANGGGPFTYSWTGSYLSGSGSTATFSPTAGGNYTLSCTVTNSNGCQTTCSISICVIDARSTGGSASNPKVYLCHLPPGNPSNAQTLSISINAVPSHLGLHSGDRLGSCAQSCGSQKTNSTVGDIYTVGDVDLIVYPNPSASAFTFQLETQSEEPVSISVYDLSGKLISEQNFKSPHDLMMTGDALVNGIYIAVVKQGDFSKNVKIQKVN